MDRKQLYKTVISYKSRLLAMPFATFVKAVSEDEKIKQFAIEYMPEFYRVIDELVGTSPDWVDYIDAAREQFLSISVNNGAYEPFMYVMNQEKFGIRVYENLLLDFLSTRNKNYKIFDELLPYIDITIAYHLVLTHSPDHVEYMKRRFGNRINYAITLGSAARALNYAAVDDALNAGATDVKKVIKDMRWRAEFIYGDDIEMNEKMIAYLETKL